MIQAISACPTTVQEILDLADKVEKDELRIDEVVDGLIDPNAKDDFDPKKADAPRRTRKRRSRKKRAEEERSAARSRRACSRCRRGAGEVRAHPPPVREAGKALENKGSKDKDYLRARDQISHELMAHPLHRAHRRAPLRQRAQPGRRDPPHERAIHDISVDKAQMPRQHFIKVFAAPRAPSAG
jgi:RNA polymerase primary sigma factor